MCHQSAGLAQNDMTIIRHIDARLCEDSVGPMRVEKGERQVGEELVAFGDELSSVEFFGFQF